jgi:hypothetical protein
VLTGRLTRCGAVPAACAALAALPSAPGAAKPVPILADPWSSYQEGYGRWNRRRSSTGANGRAQARRRRIEHRRVAPRGFERV